MSELKSFSRKRGAVQAKLTTMSKVLAQYDPTNGCTDEINGYLLNIDDLEKEFQGYHYSVLELIDEADEDENEDKLNVFIEKLMATRSHLISLRGKCQSNMLNSHMLDEETRRAWEKHIPAKTVPTVNLLMEFLEGHFNSLVSMEQGQVYRQPSRSRPASGTASATTENDRVCSLCKEIHWLYQCEQFGKLSVNDRWLTVKKTNNCFNCLSSTHHSKDCESTSKCKECNRNHHSLLHQQQSTAESLNHPKLKRPNLDEM